MLRASSLLLLLVVVANGFSVPRTSSPSRQIRRKRSSSSSSSKSMMLTMTRNENDDGLHLRNDDTENENDRRGFLTSVLKTSAVLGGTSMGLFSGLSSSSSFVAKAAAVSALPISEQGNLPDLPNDAVRSYVQYRIPFKISADYYLFSLKDMVADSDQWGDVSTLFQVNNNKGQGQPSKIERDYINPMRILLLSFPPDVSEEMRDAQFKFERAAAKISKVTSGYKRDLPVELDPASIKVAEKGWDEGRIALNEFYTSLNTAVGLQELALIPPNGPNQLKEYGRSKAKFENLQKKTKLCQNRGGPALSQVWGGLMVTGYLQDSCGIPDLNEYFNQEL